MKSSIKKDILALIVALVFASLILVVIFALPAFIKLCICHVLAGIAVGYFSIKFSIWVVDRLDE